jgi:hypothetical protein
MANNRLHDILAPLEIMRRGVGQQEMKERIAALTLLSLFVAGCSPGHMLWTKRDSWYTGFPSQPPWCDDEQHRIHTQRIVPVADARIREASALLADASIVEIDLSSARQLTGMPGLNPDELLRAAIADATARADKREKEAQEPFFATHAELFLEEVREQRAAASQAEDLLCKVKPFLVRAVVLWEGTGSFSAYWKESSLWIHHGCLGRSSAPMRRHPLVVFLEKKPTAVFNDVSMDE